MQLDVGTKVSSMVLRSVPSTANATDSKLSKSDSALHLYAFIDYAATKFVCVQWFLQNFVAQWEIRTSS